MQVASTNEQNIDLQNVQQQVIVNVKSPQGQASSIQKKYRCYFKDCNYSFLCLAELKRHIKRHSGKHKYDCDLCEKKFFSPKNLRKHKETHGVI